MEKIQKIFLEKGNVYKPSRTASVKVLANIKITAQSSLDDVRHILLDMSGIGMKFYEGQSIGVIPDGVDIKGKAHRVKLYSVASSRHGEDGKGDILALCVKRELSIKDGAVLRGLCSNYLCDAKKGDHILITGPIGRTFLLPEDTATNLLMFATGTGIAPYRGFLQYIQSLTNPWRAKCLLFMGCKTQKEAIYFNEENDDFTKYSFLQYHLALSRVDKTADGHKMYIQRKVLEYLDEIWELIIKNHFALYICGLRDMEEGLNQVFLQKAKKEGYDWEELKTFLKRSGRWNIEVY